MHLLRSAGNHPHASSVTSRSPSRSFTPAVGLVRWRHVALDHLQQRQAPGGGRRSSGRATSDLLVAGYMFHHVQEVAHADILAATMATTDIPRHERARRPQRCRSVRHVHHVQGEHNGWGEAPTRIGGTGSAQVRRVRRRTNIGLLDGEVAGDALFLGAGGEAMVPGDPPAPGTPSSWQRRIFCSSSCRASCRRADTGP